MEFEQPTEVAPESSPGIAPSTDPTSAGTQNTEQPGQVQDARGNVLPEWRVQQIRDRAYAQAREEAQREREQFQREVQQQADAREQRLIQALQRRATQPSRTPEEETQRQTALRALHDLEPGLKVMPLIGKAMVELNQRVEGLTAAQTKAQEQAEKTFIANGDHTLRTLAQQSGMRLNDQQFNYLTHQVAGIVRAQGWQDAFRAGNPNVLPAAFEILRTQFAEQARQSQAALLQTKQQTQRLPPRPGGSIPGAPAKPKLNPDDPDSVRAFEKNLRDGARQFIAANA